MTNFKSHDLAGRVSKLADYDGVVVPALKAGNGTICMQMKRGVDKAGERINIIYFSEMRVPLDFETSAAPILAIAFKKPKDLDALIENLQAMKESVKNEKRENANESK